MDKQFEQFIRERKYVTNVSPKTLVWYRESFKHLGTPTPTEADIREFIIRLRERGLKASSVNAYGRAVNCYLHWSGSPLRVTRLKEPQLTLPVFKTEDIRTLVRWKPRRQTQHRLHILVLLLIDCGLRISEALTLRWADVDFDNLLLTVTGKGQKSRTIPFSFELRKHLVRYRATCDALLVLQTSGGRALNIDNCRRDVLHLCRTLGIVPPARTLHAFRHTFATNYLRRGGSVFHLQKVLGHSTLEMTRRYANLMTEDLQAVHQKVSLLAA